MRTKLSLLLLPAVLVGASAQAADQVAPEGAGSEEIG